MKDNTFIAFTDYPFVELGDEQDKIAPIRKIKVLEYDQDKYVKIQIVGTNVTTEIKRGYIYVVPARASRYAKRPSNRAFNRLPETVYSH